MGFIVGIGGRRRDDDELLPIFRKIVSLSGKKNPSVLFVPTAGLDDIYGDENIFRIFIGLGCSVSALFLTDGALSKDEIEERILSSDVIYAGGGNLKFLSEIWKKTKAGSAFGKAYEKGAVLSGLSSGFTCWFAEGYDDCGEDGGFTFVDASGPLPFCACPHFDDENWAGFEEKIKSRKFSGIGVENGAAIIFGDGGIETICGNGGGKVWFFDKNDGFRKTLLDPASLAAAFGAPK